MWTLLTGNTTSFHYFVSLLCCIHADQVLLMSSPPVAIFFMYLPSFPLSLPFSLPPTYPLTSSLHPSAYPFNHLFFLTITITTTITVQAMDTWTYDYMSEIMVCILNYLSKVRLIKPYLTVTTVSIVPSTPCINLFI